MDHPGCAPYRSIVRWLVTAGLVTALVVIRTADAAAVPEDGGGCAIEHDLFVCGAEVDTAPSPAVTGAASEPAPQPSTGPTAQVATERFSPTTRAGTCYGATPEEDRPMLARSLLSPTGEVLRTFYSCAEETQPQDEAAPALPPAPPTQEELLSAVAIPQLTIGSNPSARGLTGLDSWFWATSPGPVSASVNLRGWQVSGTLTTTRWLWSTGDGGSYETGGPGSPGRPAVTHTYQTDGHWPVSVSVQWSGSYTVNGFGVDYTVEGLTTVGSADIDYEVVEARAVLDDTSAGGST